MSKNRPKEQEPSLDVNGKFFSVVKVSHLLYVAYEIEVAKGIVVGVRCLSRAPDQQHTAVGAATSEIWPASRDQTIESAFPGGVDAKIT
jgi:hypothetical protein